MHISMMPDGTAGISDRPSILRSALIIASGFFVNSTEPASARYSRERDSANRITSDRNQAIAMITSAITIAANPPPPPFLLLPDDELPLERHDVRPPELLKRTRNTISPANV